MKTCLIIDEMLMLYDALLANVAKVVAYVKKAANKCNKHLPFTGMNVILMGDFHQFLPITRANLALYSCQATSNSIALQGRALYSLPAIQDCHLALTTDINQRHHLDWIAQLPMHRLIHQQRHLYHLRPYTKLQRMFQN